MVSASALGLRRTELDRFDSRSALTFYQYNYLVLYEIAVLFYLLVLLTCHWFMQPGKIRKERRATILNIILSKPSDWNYWFVQQLSHIWYCLLASRFVSQTFPSVILVGRLDDESLIAHQLKPPPIPTVSW